MSIVFVESMIHQLSADGGFYTSVPASNYTAITATNTTYGFGFFRNNTYTGAGYLHTMPVIYPILSVSTYFYPESDRYGFNPNVSPSGYTYANTNVWTTLLRSGRILLQLRPITYSYMMFDAIRVAYDASPASVIPLAQSSTFVHPHGWFHFEMKVDHTANKIQVKVDEELLIDHSIVNSNALADTNNFIGLFNSIGSLMYSPMSGYAGNWIASTDWVGRASNSPMIPSDEEIPSDMQISIGSSFRPTSGVNTPVGSVANGDTDYIISDAVGAESFFQSSNNISVPSPTVQAVLVNAVSRSEVASTHSLSTAISQAPLIASQTALLHLNGSNGSTVITDESGLSWTANGGATISTTQSKFGGASAKFNGTGAYLQSSAGITLNSSDYTIECMAYFDATTYSSGAYNGRTILSNFTVQAAGRICLNVTSQGQIQIGEQQANGGGTTPLASSDINACPLQQWFHVAVSHSGSNIYLFLNGSLVGTATGNARSDYGNSFRVGAFDVSSSPYQNYWLGYIDEVRITPGVALYTSDFTPPTSEFTYVAPGNVTYPATESVGTSVQLPTSYIRTQDAFSVDPNGNPWTPTTAQSVGFGVKIVS